MPLGMEVGLIPGDFVLAEDSAPLPKKRAEPQRNFRPMSIAAKRLHESRCHCTDLGLGLRDIVLDRDPAAPLLKGHSPQFSANARCGQTAGYHLVWR